MRNMRKEISNIQQEDMERPAISSVSLVAIMEGSSRKIHANNNNYSNNKFRQGYSATPPLIRKHTKYMKISETKRRSFSACNLSPPSQASDDNAFLEETYPKENRGRSLCSSSNFSLSTPLIKTSSSFSSFCSEKRHSKIHHNALNIKGVMTWVSYILPDLKESSDTVILVIPGNPGAIEFYDRFIEQLFKECRVPIFGISHAGQFTNYYQYFILNS